MRLFLFSTAFALLVNVLLIYATENAESSLPGGWEAEQALKPQTLFQKISQRINQRIQRVAAIIATLHKLKMNNSTQLRHLVDLGRMRLRKLRHCYTDEFGGLSIDVFKQSIHETTVYFFDILEKQNIFHLNLSEIRHRVSTFVSNIRQLARKVVECTRASKEYHFKSGLTNMHLYTNEEYQGFFLNNKSFTGFWDKLQNSNLGAMIDWNLIGKFKKSPQIECLPGPEKAPDEHDWREYGVESEVRDQGQCNSCFLHATIGCMEHAYTIYRKRKYKNAKMDLFSESGEMSCLRGICKGGLLGDMFVRYVEKGAVPLGVPYSYCPKVQNRIRAKSYCYQWVNPPHDEELIKSLIYNYGPTVVSIEAGTWEFKSLRGPYPRYSSCRTNKPPNHSMLMVGYTKDYWLIKNSYSKLWGENGYFRMPRGGNYCSVLKVTGVFMFE